MAAHWDLGWRCLAACKSAPPPRSSAAAAPPAKRPRPLVQQQPAPQYIRDRIQELGQCIQRPRRDRGSLGRRGLVDRLEADELYPQQSVSKLWVVDHRDRCGRPAGGCKLDDKVTLTRDDLTLFHQPIAAMILGGGYTTTLGDLMFKAITTSDNTAQRQTDALGRRPGGGPHMIAPNISARSASTMANARSRAGSPD